MKTRERGTAINRDRRRFLKLSGSFPLGLHTVMATPLLESLFRSHAFAGGLSGNKRLLFVFQRGGNDGVNTVIPRGDSEYNTITRPTIYIPEGNGLDLGNGFAQLHPAMAPMMEIYNASSINGVDGPGNLAILHRIGYEDQSQSHFDSQQFWENGVPGNPSLEEGMLYRHVEQLRSSPEERFLATAISGSQLVALKGPTSYPAMSSLNTFRFGGTASRVDKFLGNLPNTSGGIDGKGLLGIADGPRDFAGKPYRDLVYGTTLTLSDAISIVQDALAQGTYVPENNAVYPSGGFGERLLQAALLFKRTPVKVVGVNIGGWDTHTNQGGTNGHHAGILGEVAQGFSAIYRDLASLWDDFMVITVTEFGRTSRENGGLGTDHAYSTVMFAAGGAVNGGVYNCDASTWADGDLFSQSDRYVAHRTDYRSVFADVFRWMGNDQLDATIPGYGSLASRSDFQSLDFVTLS